MIFSKVGGENQFFVHCPIPLDTHYSTAMAKSLKKLNGLYMNKMHFLLKICAATAKIYENYNFFIGVFASQHNSRV